MLPCGVIFATIDWTGIRKGRIRMIEDRLLVWKFKAGSRDALRAIYEKYADDLISLAGNLLDDKAGAEDVVQDVFMKFVETIGRFRLRGSLKGYLATKDGRRPQ